MSTITVDFKARRRAAPLTRTPPPPTPTLTTPAVAWWTCPYWCSGGNNCYGGDTLDFGRGSTVTTSRSHHGAVLAEQVVDLDGDYVDVYVGLLAIEDPNEGFTDGVFVVAQVDVTTGDLDALARIRDAVDAAIYHARQELPQITRPLPYAGGGRGSSPLEAS